MRQLSWRDVSRHRFYDEKRLNLIQQEYTIPNLRKMLKGWTWQRVVENTISATQDEGVYFHGRIGKFMNRPCIAVCALDRIVVLRYIVIDIVRSTWIYSKVIDGTKRDGFALVVSDFQNFDNIRLTDLVVGGDE